PWRPLVGTGTRLWVVVPLLSWPCELSPQHSEVPSPTSAQVKLAPLEMPVRFESETARGVSWLVVELLPICPLALRPQHFTVPLSMSVHVCRFPAAMATASEAPLGVTGVVLVVVVLSPSWP